MRCRHCKNQVDIIFADLVNSPPSNSMLTSKNLNNSERYFPLKVWTCKNCFLVQVDEFKSAKEIFDSEYTYFSSYSTSWLEHSRAYVDMMVKRFGFDENSQIIEIASNDGYLLQYFLEKNIPVLGVEPTKNTAEVAISKGIDTIVEFFGEDFAKDRLVSEGKKGDLILGNNVLAHVPDINDFVKGLKAALNEEGIITMEFPHLLNLIKESQFDTIYHEHFSYLSLISVQSIFNAYGLEIFDVEEIPTHGGSLRIFAKHDRDKSKSISKSVNRVLSKEQNFGLNRLNVYSNFQSRIDMIKNDFLSFLLNAKSEGKSVIGYGAAAKGNTMLNYCGVKGTDLIQYVCDLSPHKQGKYLPGSHIPVYSPDKIKETQPNYIIILPWNLKNEISSQLAFAKDWGAKFVTAVPELQII